MKAEEIMRALHLTAMGRVNTPEQQRLCEALEKVLAPGVEVVTHAAEPVNHAHLSHRILTFGAPDEQPKRTRKKAE